MYDFEVFSKVYEAGKKSFGIRSILEFRKQGLFPRYEKDLFELGDEIDYCIKELLSGKELTISEAKSLRNDVIGLNLERKKIESKIDGINETFLGMILSGIESLERLKEKTNNPFIKSELNKDLMYTYSLMPAIDYMLPAP